MCASVFDVARVRADACARAFVCVHQCACERTGARLHTRMRMSPRAHVPSVPCRGRPRLLTVKGSKAGTKYLFTRFFEKYFTGIF